MHVFDYIVRMGGKGQIEENTKGHQPVTKEYTWLTTLISRNTMQSW